MHPALFFVTAVALLVCIWAWKRSRNPAAAGIGLLLVAGLAMMALSENGDPVTNNPSVKDSVATDTTSEHRNDFPEPQTTERSDLTIKIRNAALTMKALEKQRPIEVSTHGYVGSKACQECHVDNHATWEASYHSKMTQVANPKAVLGDFDNVTVNHKGRQYILSKNGETCMVDMPDETDPAKRIQAPIVMTTGSHHMQVYWFATGEKRKIAMLPLIHLNDTNEWIPRDSAFLMLAHDDPSFESGRWNESCSVCHSTHRKGRRLASGDWDTHVGEFGISCEACHGPGEDHIGFHRDKVATASSPAEDPIANPEALSKVRSAQVCGQCHAVLNPLNMDLDSMENGHKYRPGKDLKEAYSVWHRDTPGHEATRKLMNYPDLDTLLNETYYPDGMIRVSGREYNGLLASKCYINGEMTCLSCHQLHKSDSDDRSVKEWATDQMKPEALGDAACTQCHETNQYASTAHTHHAIGSTGAKCYNCHMPHTAYGLLKAIRNHQIYSPDVGKDDGAERPNACNMCHLDKTLQWSADHLQEWYDIQPPKLDKDQREIAASILWLLRGNAAERAMAAWAMGWPDAQAVSGTQWQLPYLISMLDDDYDAIRLIARKTMKTLPGWDDFQLDVVTSTDSADRQKAALAAFDRWMKETATTRKDQPELLIKKTTGFEVNRLNELLRQRDNKPMQLSE